MSAELIDRFYKGGKHNPLSNFFESPFFFLAKGQGYEPVVELRDSAYFKAPTLEHAYQAMKSDNLEDFLWILECPTPGQAKRAGRRVHMRPDWEEIKIPVMRQLISGKFKEQSNRELTQFLWMTGDAYLIEGNDWNDTFWGCIKSEHGGYTQGQNWLGVLLMAERALWRFRYPNQFPML